MFTRLSLAALALAAAAAVPAPAPAQDAKKPAGLFVTTKVLPLHLDFTEKEYAGLMPAGGGGFPMFGAPAAPAKKPADGRDAHRNVFNIDLPWAFASLTAGGQRFEKVGVRYKGNGTFLDGARAAKKSFKIDLDKYAEDARLHGLKSLNLHCGITDPSKARETLAYSAYRAAGVPAPRTTLAELTVTVPGKFDKEYFGLYTVVEPVDKAFLKEWFKTDKGLLMKPERLRAMDFLGEEWERYKPTYQPKRDATEAERKRVIAFTKLVNRGTDDEFRKEIESFLDVDAFLKFLAMTAMVSNLDSYFALGHNYYLYLHPETNKFHFVPWDLDRSMGNFGIFGSMEQQMDLSVTKPYAGQSRLADRLMGEKAFADRHQAIVKELARTAFTKDWLTKELDAFEAAAKDIVAKDAKAATGRKDGPPGNYGQVPDLRTFIDKRTESIAAQVAGKSKGYTPGGFGFGAPPPAPPRPGEIFLPPPVQDALGLSPAQKKQFAELRKETEAKFEKLLTEEQRTQLRRMKQGGPGKP